MLEVGGNAQRVGQIEVPDPQNVDAVNRGDALDLFEARRPFRSAQ